MNRFVLVAALFVAGCPSSPVEPQTAEAPATATPAPVSEPVAPSVTPLSKDALRAIVDAPDRSDRDREADRRRVPVEMLAFLGVHEGMRVADIGAGTGYTTELLARAVGPDGEVVGHNTPFVLKRFAEEGWSARLAKPINANVTRVDRPFDDPFGAEVRDLDAAINVLFYHDFVWQEIDRPAHNRGVFAALRPGGVYVVIDAHAAEGAGGSVSQTLHRIERTMVIEEVTAAGFVLDDEADFLRNPSDTRDWNALPWRSEREEFSDKFVLKFRKPHSQGQ